MTYRRALHQALDGPIEYVEFQPNTDRATQRITDPEKISDLKSWLLATHEDSMDRSDPPACVCEMRFAFRDGHEEMIAHSPFRKPLGESGGRECRDDVRLYFCGHWRSGPTAALVELLCPAAPAAATFRPHE